MSEHAGGRPVTLHDGACDTTAAGYKLHLSSVGSVVTALNYTTAGWAQVLSYDTAGDAVRYSAAGSLALEFKSSTMDDFGGGTLP